ncbi:hypothetical protein IPC1122_09220 [Pseudomonas aeruginosa]|uniref:DUF1654 domain-containing protein n=1 Tax=Pseudomonadaceae TaxID=135621 RepID=UPI000FED48D6|nr:MULTISPECIES: DUF1654 domain-containing protein [Pseudomonas]MDP9942637.1 hypothetical protein [Pseudomonas sp. 3400]MDR7014924.1 hypothetical protein [Pseudomonas alcaliphila]RPQ23655.1 hypothetical protein IPC1122_09220 [Pseudomonas aeruginosa]HBO7078039.1 DUF1654 domain-containing protein [Pseudomonas aeruginosa]HBO7191040.1 DUF1654 domain-containing protein [Pseudomonas aeruginosa]
MAKSKSQPMSTPTSYEQLSMRVQRAINAPSAQKSRSAILVRVDTDSPEDWVSILNEIGENDNVTIAHRDDGYQLFWTVTKED